MSLKAKFTIIVSETQSEHHKFVQMSRYMNIVNMNIEMRANKGL
jgi:homoaconitase/3-isopropylmalate dehydratase large subunit